MFISIWLNMIIENMTLGWDNGYLTNSDQVSEYMEFNWNLVGLSMIVHFNILLVGNSPNI